MRVLVIDDDAGNRELLGIILESAGHQPVLAADADVALGLLAEDPGLQVVVTDLSLGPERTGGHRLIAGLRAVPATAALPIVVVTGVTAAAELRRARELGADLCVAKPIDVDRFLAQLAEVEAGLSA